MLHFRSRNIAGVLAFVLAGAIAVGAYAFTASNTVPAHSAGAGSAEVSGYVVTSPTNYTFSEDGLTMTEVSFNLNKGASDIKVALSAANPVKADWTDCGESEVAPYAVTCKFTTPVADAAGLKLSVAAVSTGTVTIE
jgi:hypothetical protein